MKNKDFKLLVEGFKRFLIKENNMSPTPNCERLFSAIPQEFADYINNQLEWRCGSAWLDGMLDLTPQERKMYEDKYEDIARNCGCDLDELLIANYTSLGDEIFFVNDANGTNIDLEVFVNSYTPSADGSCGTFNIDGKSLKGFREIDMLYVAPNCSGAASGSEPSKSFSSILGSAWE